MKTNLLYVLGDSIWQLVYNSQITIRFDYASYIWIKLFREYQFL